MERESMARLRNSIVWAFPLGLMFASAVTAHDRDPDAMPDPHAEHRKMMHVTAERDADDEALHIPDAVLVTQFGQEVRLASDIVADHIVVMDFVYTTCTTVCPVLSAIFSQVRAQLSETLGGEVMLVSVTVDPLRDTPEQLRAYSEKFGASSGWVWLTGTKPTMDSVLKNLGAYTPNFEDHPSIVLVGDGGTGEWSRFVGFPSAQQIVDKVNALRSMRLEQH